MSSTEGIWKTGTPPIGLLGGLVAATVITLTGGGVRSCGGGRHVRGIMQHIKQQIFSFHQ